jgi:hypothetical protein
MPATQRVVQICLFLFAAIALSGGALQMYLGQPETTPRLDNVHRFLAGIYLGCGLICLWAAITVRQHYTLVLLIGLSVFLAGTGRLLSMTIVGLPEPPALWLGYLIPELAVSCVMIVAQLAVGRSTETMMGAAQQALSR